MSLLKTLAMHAAAGLLVTALVIATGHALFYLLS